jgi:hypothetical protein
MADLYDSDEDALDNDDLEYEDEDEEDMDDLTDEDDGPIGKDDIRDDPRIISDPLQTICSICKEVIEQVSSATPELAMFQHALWRHNVYHEKVN